MRSTPPAEEVAAEMCDDLTQPPSSVPLHCCGGKSKRKLGVQMSPGRREGQEEVVLRFGFISYYSDLIGNKLNKFPRVEYVLPVTVIHHHVNQVNCHMKKQRQESDFPPAFKYMNLLLYFLSCVQRRRGVTDWPWQAPGVQTGSTQHFGGIPNSQQTMGDLEWGLLSHGHKPTKQPKSRQ